MRIICSPDSFKESISAVDAASAMMRGAQAARRDIEVDCCPIADGGEGTVDAMVAATGGQRRVSRVSGPRGEPVEATWGLLGDGKTAVIEMAAASGLSLVPRAQRDPMSTTTLGTGELIRAALDGGASTIILGIGGSATNDGGCGAAQALGVVFRDAQGKPCARGIVGGGLHHIAEVDLSQRDARLDQTRIVVACDVTNPLTGPDGAAAVYGPQKGATPQQVAQLDAGLKHLGELIRAMDGEPGSGAAGGFGGGAVAMLGATLQRGIDLVLEAVRFDERVAGCDLCLTGEGRLDGQSLSGKAIMGVTARANQAGVATIALVGSAAEDADRVIQAGLTAYHIIGEGLLVSESMQQAGYLIEKTTQRVVAALLENEPRP